MLIGEKQLNQYKMKDIQNNKKQKGPLAKGTERGSMFPKVQTLTSKMLKRINVHEIQDTEGA